MSCDKEVVNNRMITSYSSQYIFDNVILFVIRKAHLARNNNYNWNFNARNQAATVISLKSPFLDLVTQGSAQMELWGTKRIEQTMVDVTHIKDAQVNKLTDVKQKYFSWSAWIEFASSNTSVDVSK